MLETFACSRVLTLSSLRSAASGDATLRAKTSPPHPSRLHLVPLTRPRTPTHSGASCVPNIVSQVMLVLQPREEKKTYT
ncbi:hypothetical protein K466DRAFT_592153 [Polyporus arcularius HHB13444]|uniref:Uncharacterized protein n=1 Tax=Polyporus arcularius HHB13444 TaxID=1314778 RepID=A0A5C3NRK9_9APHY|nr:hypothetical protein K466DRAFT_592153 [Polyporus arcularius HHB13444]